MRRVHDYEDTHNIYLKVIVETGLMGLALLLWLMAKTFRTGYLLFRQSTEPLFAGLGLGLAAWIMCSAIASAFGDRWTYLQINGYLWVLMGLVSRAIAITSETAGGEASEEGEAEFAPVPMTAG
jgi:O-antigen ligase